MKSELSYLNDVKVGINQAMNNVFTFMKAHDFDDSTRLELFNILSIDLKPIYDSIETRMKLLGKPEEEIGCFTPEFLDMQIIMRFITQFVDKYQNRINGNEFEEYHRAKVNLYEGLKNLIGEDVIRKNEKRASNHKQEFCEYVEKGVIEPLEQSYATDGNNKEKTK